LNIADCECLALIGFKASGKTTLGKLLAHHLNYSFIDTDDLIEEHCKPYSCRQIFQEFGGEYFRKLEAQVVADLDIFPKTVLAIGGGTLLETTSRKKLKSQSTLIYLKTAPEILKERIWQQPQLPAYLNGDNPDDVFTSLYQKSIAVYQECADYIIEMDELDLEQAAAMIVSGGTLGLGILTFF
jgi:shikimate kinase